MKNHIIKTAVVALTAAFLVFGPDALAEVFVPETMESAVVTVEDNGTWGDCRSLVLADGVNHLEPAPIQGEEVAVETPVAKSPTVQGDNTTKDTAESKAEVSRKTYRGFSEGDVVRVTVTHYCPCAKCNGADNVGIAANGERLREGMAALNWLPLGSVVVVNGKRYIITDRGVGKGKIDVFVKTHAYANKLGKFQADLLIIQIGK